MFSYRRDAQVTFVANNFKNQQHIQIIRKRFVVYQALPSLHGGSFEKNEHSFTTNTGHENERFIHKIDRRVWVLYQRSKQYQRSKNPFSA